MTIYEIKRQLSESKHDTHFFDRKTLKFFGQTLKSFKVQKIDNRFYFVTAPIYLDGKQINRTIRWYDSVNNCMLSERSYNIARRVQHHIQNSNTPD